MSNHTKQNQFHGSSGAQRPVKGGLQTVIARHVIGAFDCWCQGELCWVDLSTGMQTWTGKEQGRPHPRPVDIVKELVGMVTTYETLERSDVKKYPNRVADLLMTLVNDCHIRYRILDGESMLLYPPDGLSRPFKVMSRRSERASLGFIEKQFIATYDIHLPEKKKEKPVGEPTTTFVTTPPAPQVVTPPAPAPKPTALPAHPVGDAPDVAVWTVLRHSKTDEPMEFETDGKRFRCLTCKALGEESIFTERLQLGGHTRAKHRSEGLHTPEARAKAVETKRYNRLVRNVGEAVALLQDAAGLPVQSDTVEALEARIEEMSAVLAQVTAERDAAIKRANDLEARLELVREQFSAVMEA